MDIPLKLNFAENYCIIEGPRKNPGESSLKEEMRSQLKIGVKTRSFSVQLFPSHDITKNSLEREIEGCIKLVMTGN